MFDEGPNHPSMSEYLIAAADDVGYRRGIAGVVHVLLN